MQQQEFSLTNWLRTPLGICLLVAAAISAAYLALAHTIHVLGVLPYFLILLCPVLHLLMHGGHSQHGTREQSQHVTAADQSPGQTDARCH